MSDFNEMHAENQDKILSDLENLQVADQIARDFLRSAGEEQLCFAALVPFCEVMLDAIQHNNSTVSRRLMSQEVTVAEARDEVIAEVATQLLLMYHVGFEMGKKNHKLWTHVILNAAVDEAEHLLRGWK